MFFDKQNGKPVHEKAHMYAKEYADGQLSRREFLVRATALGVSATTAYALIGQNAAKHRSAGRTRQKWVAHFAVRWKCGP